MMVKIAPSALRKTATFNDRAISDRNSRFNAKHHTPLRRGIAATELCSISLFANATNDESLATPIYIVIAISLMFIVARKYFQAQQKFEGALDALSADEVVKYLEGLGRVDKWHALRTLQEIDPVKAAKVRNQLGIR